MPKPGDGEPTVANRWWVDSDTTKERATPAVTRERPPIGSRFFDIGYEFDQEHAKQRLTDINLKILAAAQPDANEWRLVRMVPDERVPLEHIERIKGCLPLPPARGAW